MIYVDIVYVLDYLRIPHTTANEQLRLDDDDSGWLLMQLNYKDGWDTVPIERPHPSLLWELQAWIEVGGIEKC